MRHIILAITLVIGGLVPQAPFAQTPDEKKEIGLVYAVTRAGDVPFRNKPNAATDVSGYFPGQQAVWVVRPSEDWVLVHYKNIAGWVAKTDLYAIFTLDPKTKLPN